MSYQVRGAKSPRTKRSRDNEIEKLRTENNWKRLIEIQNLRKSSGVYHNLVSAEAAIETFLEDNDISNCVSDTKLQLAESERKLRQVTNSKSDDEQLRIEASLLLSKMLFMKQDLQEALNVLESVSLEDLSPSVPVSRFTKLLAEANAIKGSCLERVGGTRGSTTKALSSFERSGQLCLMYLQNSDLEKPGMSAIVETALQRSPILCVQLGQVSAGVNKYRSLLRAAERPSLLGLRQTLARQLAEVLLRGVCRNSYERVISDPRAVGPAANEPSITKYTGSDRFVPEDLLQEAVLVLLVSEYIAYSDAILNRGNDTETDRRLTFDNTTAVYDLLCVALVRRGAYSFLANSLEHALKFSYQEFHVWWQLGLALASAGGYRRALLVLRECARLQPDHCPVRLLAARLCLEQLYQAQEGLAWAEAALVCAERADSGLQGRAHLLVAVGCLMSAGECRAVDERREWMCRAANSLERGVELDPYDHLLHYHRGLALAQQRKIAAALSAVHTALSLSPSHAPSLHLLALLHTSARRYSEADRVLCAAVADHPSHVSLLLTKARLDAVKEGPKAALATYKRLLEVWKEHYAADSDSSLGFVEKMRNRMSQMEGEMTDRSSGSVRAESVAASRMEAALTELASSAHSATPEAQLDESAYLQIQILLNLGDLYLEQKRPREAKECIEDAAGISRLYHQVLYSRGRLHEERGELESAKVCYESAVSLNPSHVRSLQRLGRLLHDFGENQLAEKMLRDALAADPTSSASWQLLGDVLSFAGQEESAAHCLQTAADLEQTEPVEPFHFLGRGIHLE